MSVLPPSTPTPERSASPGLLGLLKRLSLVSEEHLEAVERAPKNMKLIGALASVEVADEDILIEAIAKDLSVDLVDLNQADLQSRIRSGGLFAKFDTDLLFKHRVVPIDFDGKQVTAAFADPLDVEAISALEFVLGSRITVNLTTELQIVTTLQKFASSKDLDDAADLVSANATPGLSGALDLEISFSEENEEGADSSESMKAGSESAPVVRLVNKILADALAQNASDIHLEPSMGSLEVRFRVDGVMNAHLTVPKRLQPYMLTRLKLLSGMNITERRRPQDGRFRIKSGPGETADIRASSVPSAHGESIVLRILKSNSESLRLDNLGMNPELLARLDEVLSARDRLVVVTGPTGSGKSTTLYSALYQLKQGDTNIITVEDPVEYRIEGITQIQVDTKVGMTFAGGLRSILRQDPDIILLGEIRDLETAEVAFQAAQTGHLVLSTLHTNSASAAVVRLVDLGLEPFVIAPSLGAVLAQRLVRKLCEHCREPLAGDEAESVLERLGLASETVYQAKGCKKCDSVGYRGRQGVYSLLVVDQQIREVIRAGGSESEIEAAAMLQGMESMFDYGLRLVTQGVTTVEEIERVLGRIPKDKRFASATLSVVSPVETAAPDAAPVAEDEMLFPVLSKSHSDEHPEVLEIDSVEDLRDSFIAGAEEASENFNFDEAIKAAESAAFESGSIADLAASYHIAEAVRDQLPKVLLVDDDAGVRAVMSRALRRAEYEVLEASDGLDALQKLDDFQPDIVVSDLMMPRLSGEGFVEALRERPSTMDVPVLMLTGSDTEENEVRLIEAGANDFVSKASSPAVVLARVKRLLG